ncbi:toprim domain-containing protein [Pseudothauera rhizosphaerae]|uniref:DUF2399 domain-containing protein n=1 Tax=Pseudothauera rhizosphaerae TaxID=2565932 RepID=A0A4S4AML6_9RHOO|nr:DUF2399 domain-containing protein [Pseudothauera rhizosphaerae]THF60815.1 DUF2399 domain-containing protein [Pseudothauera rhizosphaerae]
MPAVTEPHWLPPDAHGLSTAWLTDPARSTLRGKRLRRAFDRPPAALDTWPAPWRELLGAWVRRATPDKHCRHEALLKQAGAGRANTALALFERLLADGLAEVEERRAPPHGWQAHSLRFIDPAALRRALGLPEPDAARQEWAQRVRTAFDRPDLDAARTALDTLPPASALARLQLLEALAEWARQSRDGGSATRRDLAYFARQDTKKITDAEWQWLADNLDLAAFGIAAHAPLLLIAAGCRLESGNGTLDLAALPAFIGLPPQAVQAIARIHAPPRRWRLVENRSAFEKAAAAREPNEAVLWLPGYPPGWWREAVAHLLELAPAPAAIACDPDPDGIAIALQAAGPWQAAGQAWEPWHMGGADLHRLAHRRPLTERDRGQLERLRQRGDLPPALAELADAMLELGEKGEQESLFW